VALRFALADCGAGGFWKSGGRAAALYIGLASAEFADATRFCGCAGGALRLVDGCVWVGKQKGRRRWRPF
jgi:hypothetical protein